MLVQQRTTEEASNRVTTCDHQRRYGYGDKVTAPSGPLASGGRASETR